MSTSSTLEIGNKVSGPEEPCCTPMEMFIQAHGTKMPNPTDPMGKWNGSCNRPRAIRLVEEKIHEPISETGTMECVMGRERIPLAERRLSIKEHFPKINDMDTERIVIPAQILSTLVNGSKGFTMDMGNIRGSILDLNKNKSTGKFIQF